MKFCDKCGSYMKWDNGRLVCSKCGSEESLEKREFRRVKLESEPVYVAEKPREEAGLVARSCPECKHEKAIRKAYSIQGEHAGVKRDRFVERFRCANCGYTWSVS